MSQKFFNPYLQLENVTHFVFKRGWFLIFPVAYNSLKKKQRTIKVQFEMYSIPLLAKP